MMLVVAVPALVSLALSFPPSIESPPGPPISLVATQLITLTPRAAKARTAIIIPVPVVATREPRVVCGMTIVPPVTGCVFPMHVERPASGVKYHMRVVQSDMCADR